MRRKTENRQKIGGLFSPMQSRSYIILFSRWFLFAVTAIVPSPRFALVSAEQITFFVTGLRVQLGVLYGIKLVTLRNGDADPVLIVDGFKFLPDMALNRASGVEVFRMSEFRALVTEIDNRHGVDPPHFGQFGESLTYPQYLQGFSFGFGCGIVGTVLLWNP